MLTSLADAAKEIKKTPTPQSSIEEVRDAILDLAGETPTEHLEEETVVDSYNWCGEPSQESPCIVGQHPEYVSINARLLEAEELSLLAEEYDLPEKALYDHLTRKHFRDDPRNLQRAKRTAEVENELVEKLQNNEDEYEVLGLVNEYLLQNMMEKIKEASPMDLIRFLREYRQTAVDRKRMRDTEKDRPTVQVDQLTINQNDVFLSRILEVLEKLCPHDRLLIEQLIPGMDTRMEHVVDPEKLMLIEGGAELDYIHDVQKTYETEHGEYIGDN